MVSELWCRLGMMACGIVIFGARGQRSHKSHNFPNVAVRLMRR